MADPELVAYLKKNLKQFGKDPLRAKLLSQGVAEEEIDAALKAAAAPPAKRPGGMFYVLFAAGLILIGIYWMTNSAHRESSTEPSQSGPERMFMGKHGFMVKTPQGYVTLTDFTGPQGAKEVVYLYPKGIEPANLLDEGLYGQLGILRLEVSPLRVPEGHIGIQAVRAGVAATLQSRKAAFTTQETQAAGLPAIIVNITSPTPLVQGFVVGTKLLFILTGGAQDALFNDTLNSLHETSVENNPLPSN